MKNLSRYSKPLMLLGIVVVILVVSCSKKDGYYAAGVEDKAFDGNTYNYLQSKPGTYDSLLKAINRLDSLNFEKPEKERIKERLSSGKEATTLFAVTNSSFELAFTSLNNLRKLSQKPPLSIASIDIHHLDTMVCQYIIEGKVTSDDLSSKDGINISSIIGTPGWPMHLETDQGASAGFVQGGASTIKFFNTNKSQFTRDWVGTSTSSSNIKTKTGVVHIVEAGHVFGFNKFVSRITIVPPPENYFKKYGGTFTGSYLGTGTAEVMASALDNDRNSKFVTSNFVNGWIKWEFPYPVAAGSYVLISGNDNVNWDPQAWKFEGSNNNIDWPLLDSQLNQVFKYRIMERVFYFNNTIPYKFYRITFSAMRSGTKFQITEFSINGPKKN
jgi:hypothetical protein